MRWPFMTNETHERLVGYMEREHEREIKEATERAEEMYRARYDRRLEESVARKEIMQVCESLDTLSGVVLEKTGVGVARLVCGTSAVRAVWSAYRGSQDRFVTDVGTLVGVTVELDPNLDANSILVELA